MDNVRDVYFERLQLATKHDSIINEMNELNDFVSELTVKEQELESHYPKWHYDEIPQLIDNYHEHFAALENVLGYSVICAVITFIVTVIFGFFTSKIGIINLVANPIIASLIWDVFNITKILDFISARRVYNKLNLDQNSEREKLIQDLKNNKVRLLELTFEEKRVNRQIKRSDAKLTKLIDKAIEEKLAEDNIHDKELYESLTIIPNTNAENKLTIRRNKR